MSPYERVIRAIELIEKAHQQDNQLSKEDHQELTTLRDEIANDVDNLVSELEGK